MTDSMGFGVLSKEKFMSLDLEPYIHNFINIYQDLDGFEITLKEITRMSDLGSFTKVMSCIQPNSYDRQLFRFIFWFLTKGWIFSPSKGTKMEIWYKVSIRRMTESTLDGLIWSHLPTEFKERIGGFTSHEGYNNSPYHKWSIVGFTKEEIPRFLDCFKMVLIEHEGEINSLFTDIKSMVNTIEYWVKLGYDDILLMHKGVELGYDDFHQLGIIQDK